MRNEITLKVGEMVAMQGNFKIKSLGIGSCAIIVMHDKKNRIGAICHSMLPRPFDEEPSKGKGREDKGLIIHDAKYIEPTIPKMFKLIKELGAEKKNIKVKIVGGAAMFKTFINNNVSVGSKNIDLSKKIIEEIGLHVDSEDTGGNHGRSIIFNNTNGILNVNTRI